jgi:hypothetical protein
MAKSCSAEYERGQLPFRAAEVEFDNLLKSTLKNDITREMMPAYTKNNWFPYSQRRRSRAAETLALLGADRAGFSVSRLCSAGRGARSADWATDNSR